VKGELLSAIRGDNTAAEGELYGRDTPVERVLKGDVTTGG
jgi:hypothetical protein